MVRFNTAHVQQKTTFIQYLPLLTIRHKILNLMSKYEHSLEWITSLQSVYQRLWLHYNSLRILKAQCLLVRQLEHFCLYKL